MPWGEVNHLTHLGAKKSFSLSLLSTHDVPGARLAAEGAVACSGRHLSHLEFHELMRGNPACLPPGTSVLLPSRRRGAGVQVLLDKHCWESGLLRGALSGSLELKLSAGARKNTI